MIRRNAIAIAVAAGGTVLAAGAAFAANVGLLEEGRDPVGQLEPTNVGALLTDEQLTSTTTPQTIIIDVPVPAVVDNGPAVPSVPSGGSIDDGSFDDDDAFDDHGGDRDDDESDDDDDAFDDHGGDRDDDESDDHDDD